MEKKSYIVAVDVGSSEVTIAIGSFTDEGAIHIEGIVTEPCEGMSAGLIDNNHTVGAALRAAREKAEQMVGVAITDAYVSISGKFVRCARYTDHVFVEDSQDCIAQRDLMALRERMHNVKAADGEVIMDLFPICYKSDMGAEMKNPVGSYSKQLTSTYNFILCERPAKDRFRRLFLDASIKIQDMFASAAVVAESVVTAEEKEEGVAVIDIGSGVTDIAIYHGGALCYMVSIPIGGSAINADIRHYASQLPMPAIESLKRVYGSAMVSMTPEGLIEVQRGNRYLKPIPRHNLASIIEARMTDIADYVWNEIREANFAKKLSAGIVLTGGVANLKNVAELFQSVTGIETRVACAELGITSESLEMVASPNLTLAVSLLLRGAQKGATPVSILQRPIQEPVQPEKPTVVVEPVKEPKQEVKPEEKVVTPPTSLNEKLAQQEQEKTTPVEEEEKEEEIDIIENDDTTEQSWWSKFKTKIQKRFDDAFQNPDEEDDNDNDEY